MLPLLPFARAMRSLTWASSISLALAMEAIFAFSSSRRSCSAAFCSRAGSSFSACVTSASVLSQLPS